MNILLILKGIIIGVGKILPGVSGSIMAIGMNIYDKAIDSVVNFFSDTKNNFIYLFNLGLGIIIGIVIFSKIILYLLEYYYSYVMFLFIGFIIGGIRSIYKEINIDVCNIIVMIISFIIVSYFSAININNIYSSSNIIIYFISGLLEGIGTIVPGISSTLLLMIMGTYNLFISSISNIYNISYVYNNIEFYISFGIGLFISIIMCIYIINYLFKYKKSISYSIIMGIILSNIINLLYKVVASSSNILLCLGILLGGIIISYKYF